MKAILVVDDGTRQPAVLVEEETTPEQQAEFAAGQERHRRNRQWFNDHYADLRARYPGQHVTVAGGEAFADPDVMASIARARAAHPEDAGSCYVRLIPSEPAGRP